MNELARKAAIAITGAGIALAAPAVPIYEAPTVGVEKVLFDTESGWLEPGQYAREPGIVGIVWLCEPNEKCAHDIPLRSVPENSDLTGYKEVKVVGRQYFGYYGPDRVEKTMSAAEYSTASWDKKAVRFESVGSYIVDVAEAAVAIGNETNTSEQTNASSLTFSSFVASGSEIALVVTCSAYENSTGNANISSATWNTSESLTVGTRSWDASYDTGAYYAYRTNVTATTANISVSFSGSNDAVYCQATAVTGADTTDARDAAGTGNGITNNATISVTTVTDGALVIGQLSYGATSAADVTPVQTQLSELEISAGNVVGNTSYTTTTTAGVKTLTWNGSAGTEWNTIGIAIKPSAGGGGGGGTYVTEPAIIFE